MMSGWGNMWNYGYGNGWGGNGGYWWVGLIGLALQLLFWIAIIVIAVKLFHSYEMRTSRGAGHNQHNAAAFPQQGDRSLDILRERYARGEIDTEEYQRRKNDLMS